MPVKRPLTSPGQPGAAEDHSKTLREDLGKLAGRSCAAGASCRLPGPQAAQAEDQNPAELALSSRAASLLPRSLRTRSTLTRPLRTLTLPLQRTPAGRWNRHPPRPWQTSCAGPRGRKETIMGRFRSWWDRWRIDPTPPHQRVRWMDIRAQSAIQTPLKPQPSTHARSVDLSNFGLDQCHAAGGKSKILGAQAGPRKLETPSPRPPGRSPAPVKV